MPAMSFHFKQLTVAGLIALGALAGAAAHADDALAPEQTPTFAPSLSRSAVRPDAVAAARAPTLGRLSDQETPRPLPHMANRADVRAEAVAALRSDQIPYGEVGGMTE